MMSFENFVEYVKGSIHHYLPPKFENTAVRITEVNKNNNLHFTGIIIVDPDSNMSPTIYLENIFSKYESGNFELDECVREIAERYLDNLVSGDKTIEIRHLMSYENAKDKVIPRLVSSEDNEAYLKDIPHRIMDGLAVVYYLPVTEFNDKGGKASVCIHNGILKDWGITEAELYETAVANLSVNMEAKFQSMREVLLEAFFAEGEDIDEQWALENLPPEDTGMYVLTNHEKFYGAAMLLNHNVMDGIVERIGEFYILPSSVHETIFVKKDAGPPFEDLEEMVREINQTEVEVDERLSDRVFLYDAKTKEIYRADHEEEHRKRVAEAARDSEEQAPARTTPSMPHMRRGR